MKLSQIIEVKVGKNLSRGRVNSLAKDSVYNYEDLVSDLNNVAAGLSNNNNSDDPYQVKAGEVVYSFVSSTAGIVSKENQGKTINQNFAKLIFDESAVDGRYLCYILNKAKKMQKQITIAMQGSIIRKLTSAILKNLEIELPDLNTQQTIGQTYFQLLRRQALIKKQSILEEQVIMEMLDKMDHETSK